MSDPQFSVAGMGGTFDHFHLGHQHFLNFASQTAQYLLIGVTTSEMVGDKELSQLIQPYEVRAQAVSAYLAEKNISGEVFPLEDPYGPTLENSKVEVIVVTEHTQKGGELINQKRAALQLPLLPIKVAALIKDETGEYISSTRIRRGVVNRSGQVYAQIFLHDLSLNADQKAFFQQPQGKYVTLPSTSSSYVYAVGDIVSENFVKNNWPFNAVIFDQRNHRQEYLSPHLNFVDLKRVDNSPGIISQSMCSSLSEYLNEKNIAIRVEGEEDLAAVALVLLAPLDSTIYYGQREQGMIEMIASEELKDKFYSILFKGA
jgi:pantetheine-phosphate adenylyltransferase